MACVGSTTLDVKKGLQKLSGNHQSSYMPTKCHGCSIDSSLVATRRVLPSGCVVVELVGNYLGCRCSLHCDGFVVGRVYCCE